MCHSVRVDTDTLDAIRLQETLQKYSYLYDLSRSEKEKVHDQAVAMCLDGQPLSLIRQLLEVAVGPLDISPKAVVQSAVGNIISALR